MKKNNIFWVGYSDLLTSLFFVMLVLFVTTVGYLQYQKKITEEQLNKIEELQAALTELPENYFDYQEKYKRFRLSRSIQFKKSSAEIATADRPYLIEVGQEITKLINKLQADENYKQFDIKYLIVIEGMASKDDYLYNFELSYERALSLYQLWKEVGITFQPEICEIQIAGSGTDGVRIYSGKEEFKNQQFLIHIVPKIGKIDFNS